MILTPGHQFAAFSVARLASPPAVARTASLMAASDRMNLSGTNQERLAEQVNVSTFRQMTQKQATFVGLMAKVRDFFAWLLRKDPRHV